MRPTATATVACPRSGHEPADPASAINGGNVDRLEVTAATLEDGGKSVFLTVKGLRQAMQRRVAHPATKTLIHSTVHRLAPAEKR